MTDRLRPEARFRPEAWLRALLGRRLLIGVGAALLIGGWGTTRYAHEQQMSRRLDGNHRAALWGETRHIYGAGVLGMAVGAGLIGFAILPRAKGGER